MFTLLFRQVNKSLADSQAEDEAFGTYQWCLFKNHILLEDRMDLFDSEFVSIMIQGKHEGTNIELTALYLYDQIKDSDLEGVIDPKTCGLRYVDVN